MIRPGAALAAAALSGAAAISAWAAPATAHDGQCHGVVVVVDFGDAGSDAGLGEQPRVGCAEDPSSGLEALTQAGFAITEVTTFPGLVCQIDGFPETECAAAPPVDRTWSYWHAGETDDEWAFSPVGAGTFDPDQGDVEGWAFGDGTAPPAVAPDQVEAAEPVEGAETESARSLTWVVAVVILAAIAGLVIWRLRRDRRA